MNIVIIGDGKVGFKLAKLLSEDENNVTIIDNNESKLTSTGNMLDVQCVYGNGASAQDQANADMANADLAIACTSSDEINMLTCLIAKKLGADHTIARVRNPIYYDQMDLLKDDLKLTMYVNPEKVTARAISRIIMYPNANHIETFGRETVEILDYTVPKNSPMIGKTLGAMGKIYSGNRLVVAVESNDEVFIPDGNYEVKSEDILHFVFDRADIDSFFEQLGVRRTNLKKIMICGGGRISYYLAQELIKSGKDVKIIEKDLEKCKEYAELLPQATIINGDATDHDLLREENIAEADVFVGLTGMDEENMISGLFAKQIGIKKVIIKVNEDQRAKMMTKLGIESVLSAKSLTANVIMSYVTARKKSHESETVDAVYELIDGKVRALEFHIEKDTKYTDRPLRELNVKKGSLITCIIRNGKPIIPDGQTRILMGDTVIIVTDVPKASSLEDIL